MAIYLGRRSPGASCSLPGARKVRAAPCSCLALLPTGVAWPRTLLPAPVGSYSTFSPSRPPPYSSPKFVEFGGGREGVALCLCGPIRRVPGVVSSPLPGNYPALCSMECGLSSEGCPIFFLDTPQRPSGRPEVSVSYHVLDNFLMASSKALTFY